MATRWIARSSLRMTAFLALLLLGTGCASLFEESRNEVIYDFQFEQTDQEWTAQYADYATSMDSASVGFRFAHLSLPEPTNSRRMGLFLGGTNVSDDLFMFVKRRIPELTPGATYEVRYTIEIASNAPSGCSGIGGAPGESVFLKGGVSQTEPVPAIDGDHYRMNVDKGNQSQEGDDAVVIGTIANGNNNCEGTPYEMVTIHSQNNPVEATADEEGALWFFVGTDSGFEGRTELFLDSIEIRLELQ